jgi:hypothetical protein
MSGTPHLLLVGASLAADRRGRERQRSTRRRPLEKRVSLRRTMQARFLVKSTSCAKRFFRARSHTRTIFGGEDGPPEGLFGELALDHISARRMSSRMARVASSLGASDHRAVSVVLTTDCARAEEHAP